jgi:predicted nucleic acid-binding protein
LAVDRPIDVTKLPNVALFDTGVLIRALGDTPGGDAETCRALWDAMVEHDRKILVAAPSLTEMLRDDSRNRSDHPMVRGLEVVAYDQAAATLLGEKLPWSRIQDIRADERRDVVPYDAMIVACAARWRADVLVSCDERRMVRIAEQLGIRWAHPREFLAEQAELRFGDDPSRRRLDV